MRKMRMPPQRRGASPPSEGVERRKAFWGRILGFQKPIFRGRRHERPVSQGPFVRGALSAIALENIQCLAKRCENDGSSRLERNVFIVSVMVEYGLDTCSTRIPLRNEK